MSPESVKRSAQELYGISLSSDRASEVAKEVSSLLAAVEPFMMGTTFDDWPDEFVAALAAVAKLEVQRSND